MSDTYKSGNYDGVLYTILNDWVFNNTLQPVPDFWDDGCTRDGWDSAEYFPIPEDVWRPCKHCGNYPTEEGDYWCLVYLGNVMNACCGHGSRKGYIQFDKGIIVSGYFTIEKFNYITGTYEPVVSEE